MNSKKEKEYNQYKWNDEEDQRLIKELISNVTIRDIAKFHGKSQESINQRRKAISYKLYKKKIPLEKISQLTKLEKEEITRFIYQRKDFLSERKCLKSII